MDVQAVVDAMVVQIVALVAGFYVELDVKCLVEGFVVTDVGQTVLMDAGITAVLNVQCLVVKAVEETAQELVIEAVDRLVL